MIAGRLGEDEVLLIRDGDEVHAVGASCPHYHAPLVEGLVTGGTLRCPWHHACFDLATGAVLRAPALAGLPVWRVERRGDRYFIGEKWSGGRERRRHAARRGIHRQHRDARPRHRPSVRQAESLERLSGGQRSGGVAAVT
ncbi:MAG TPA: Rieske 2Fe-2S domain-containing protein, partial [Thermoanaerobaculia bacterium]|nr:Rieske 2Fe-2S domain-containing protein [Thermoanaerobaculia bacterium]